MKHFNYLLVSVCLVVSLQLRADEGMWIPSLLEAVEDDMKAFGMKLSAEDIYSINNSSMKDAVIHFGGGCTAEIVSDQGLILTNHHCGYSYIQSHSTMEDNYLENGFWAMSQEEELACPGLTATRIVRIQDVTTLILEGITDDMDPAMRATKINSNITSVKTGAETNHYNATIKPFYYGNEYYMIITETFTDIRMVGAPPSSIGKYGFDTDNWVWPRHTGDFSVFRIYANTDNQPADYDEANVPYTPLYHFPVSLEEQNEGDFTMIYGFPGTTQQYLTSYAVDFKMNVENPARIAMRDASLAILWTEMQADEQVKLQYASKQSSISNAWKKWKGENTGLIATDAMRKKLDLEAEFQELVANSTNVSSRYKTLLAEFEQLYNDKEKYSMAYAYFVELVYYGPAFLRYTNGFEDIVENYAIWDQSTRDEAVSKLQGKVAGYFKNYNAAVDQKLFVELFALYLEGLDKELHPDIAKEIDKKYKGSVKDYAHYLYNKSVFINEASMADLLKNFSSSSVKKIKKDPAYILMQDVYSAFYDKALEDYRIYLFAEDELMRLYVKALSEVLPAEVVWPDANSTLRVAFGKIEGSYPRDGIKYTYYTTLEGVMEKYIPGDPEFDLPKGLIDLYESRDYGQYAQDGELRVCFTASNHTTGGNSGSPVLDAYGNLIGINFDRSWESTMSDVMYDPNLCRNIVVDIRYVLFIIDKFAGATHLVEEMDLVTEETKTLAHQLHLKDWIVTLTDSLQVTPEDYSIFALRADAYAELEMYSEALLDYAAVLDESSKDYEALMGRGLIYVSMDRNMDALKEFNLLVKYNSTDANAYYQRGLAYKELGKYSEAISDFGKTIKYDKFNAHAYYGRSICYHLQGKKDLACDDMYMARSLGDYEADVMYHVVCE